MKRILYLLIVVCSLASCQSIVPTPVPLVIATNEPPFTPFILPTLTPVPLNDPGLAQVEKELKDGLDQHNPQKVQDTISFIKWVGAIYRVGGTPPIDPMHGMNLTMEYAKENKLTIDLDRKTYEPRWSTPAGDTSILAYAIPTDPSKGDPFYAHLYVSHEPGGWRYTGILSRVPYYDAPSIAQVIASPNKYAGKEYMYVGAYASKANLSANAGAPPTDKAFLLNTWSGLIWVNLKSDSYVPQLPSDIDTHNGELMRVFGIVTLKNGVPYLDSDSAEFIDAKSWAHVKGTISSIDASTRRVTIQPDGAGPAQLEVTTTSFISLPGDKRGALSDLKVGETVDASGTPKADGTLVVEELFPAS